MKLLGPVFPVEWRTNARQPRFFWLRAFYGGLLLVALGNVFVPELVNSGGLLPATRVAPLAGQFFWAFSIVQLLVVLLITPALTAGSIAEEKERRTLEQLLTTDLSATELILGKLSARMLLMIGVVSAGLPVLALTVWLGGTSADNLLAVTVLTLIMLLASGSLSLWISIHARRGREALQLVYIAGVIIGIFPPLFALSVIPWPGGIVGTVLHGIDDLLIAPNPMVWFLRAWQDGLPHWDEWTIVILANVALSIVLVFLSVLQVRKTALGPSWASPGKLHRLLRPRLGKRCLLWKELFTQPPAAGLERLARIVMALIGWGALFWMLWVLAVTLANPTGGRTPFQVFAIIVEPPLLCIALLGVTGRAATCVSLERERGTWESLLTTPCNSAEIITAKLLGSLFSARWLWLLVGLLWVLGVVSGQLRPAAFAGTALLVTVLAACAATTGLLLSLRLKSSLRALTTAMGLGLVLSGGYLLCTLPLLMPLGGAKEPPFWLLSPCVPFLLITSMLLGIENLPNSPQMIAACGLGGAFYAVTALTVFLIVWRWFDRLAGRGYSSRRS